MHPKPESVTLEEVARLARVSTSTVSRYLSGTHRVSPKKAAAIKGSIEQLHYRPNLVARGLAKGSTMTVGVLTQEISSTYFNETLRGVDDALLAHGYEAIFVNGHWNAAEQSQRLESLIGRRVEGVILLQADLTDEVLESHASGMSVVLIGRTSALSKVHSLNFDHYHGARGAMQHLLDLGHRRIAFISGPAGRADADERLRGYSDALTEAGIGFDSRLIAAGDYVEPGGMAAMNALLDRGLPFTAVFASNDDSAYGAMLAMSRRGVRVPEDVSIVGYDDLQHSSYCVPPLTTVRQPLRELGREAAHALVALMEGRRPAGSPLPPLRLVIRESTRAVPVAIGELTPPAIALPARRPERTR
jgi:LacI family transcriptional regulator